MEKIRGWLAKRGFELRVAGRVDIVDYANLTVHVSTRQNARQRLHSALHECGHVDLFHARVKKRRVPYAGATFRRWTRNKRRSAGERLLVLEEEIEAWRRGDALGRRLGLRLASSKAQEAHRVRSLWTYVRWALARQKRAAAARSGSRSAPSTRAAATALSSSSSGSKAAASGAVARAAAIEAAT